MKNLIFAAVLLLLTARVAEAVSPFKSYTFANYGSPFTYVPTTAQDLVTVLDGGSVNSGGYPTGTFAQLFHDEPTSVSDSYDPGVGLHVAFSATSVYHPAEALSTDAPGIGAKVSAENTAFIGSTTVIGESYVYLKKKVTIDNPNDSAHVLKSFATTVNLDGIVHVSGDAIVLVGEAIRIVPDGQALNGNFLGYTISDMQSLQQGFGGVVNSYYFGQPGFVGLPITLTNDGPYGAELTNQGSRSMIVETLLYVRAQTGVTNHTAGMASADFSNTLRVSNIQFFDENDQVIPGLRVIGEDGEVYPYNVVPEPAALVLFGVGSIGMLLTRNSRRRPL